MATPSPLAVPLAWNLVSAAYTRELIPQFELFAADALRIAGPLEGKRVIDVACGPGSLTLLAARTAAHVEAVDFSSEMLAQLTARLAAEKVHNVVAREADGQALPYGDREFSAAFSMFGLIFFPDRAKGLSEMKRVLEPGTPAIVGSWTPFDETPVLTRLFALLREHMPDLPFGQQAAPLGTVDDIRAELSGAGLSSIEIASTTHGIEAPSADELWGSFERTMAPLVLLRKKLPDEAWQRLSDGVRAGFRRDFGDGPIRMDMRAWITCGLA